MQMNTIFILTLEGDRELFLKQFFDISVFPLIEALHVLVQFLV